MKIESIDEYISTFPEDIQIILQRIRKTIRQSAPKAQETISYRMPTFKQNGNLVHFAAFKDHIGFFPTSSPRRVFQKELSKYKGGPGTIQFQLDEPIPYSLIKKIVKYRIKENLGKQPISKQ